MRLLERDGLDGEPMKQQTHLCAKCGHLDLEHGVEEAFYYTHSLATPKGSKVEVCLSCVGWPDKGSPPRGSKARHRFVVVSQ